MERNVIRFSYNWNGKLDNKAFTTIRIHNPKKYIVGNSFQIELNEKSKGMAVLTKKWVLNIDQLNDHICFLDTGYDRIKTTELLKRMYKNIDLQTVMLDLCLLVYTKPEKPESKAIQTSLALD